VTQAACPCGSVDARGHARPLGDCCGPIIADPAAAPDAARLMRSRYTAHVLLNEAHLLATWHPSTRPDSCELDGKTRWLGLEVKAHKVIDVANEQVHFVARYRENGKGQRMQERSLFVRESNQWFYVRGEAP